MRKGWKFGPWRRTLVQKLTWVFAMRLCSKSVGIVTTGPSITSDRQCRRIKASSLHPCMGLGACLKREPAVIVAAFHGRWTRLIPASFVCRRVSSNMQSKINECSIIGTKISKSNKMEEKDEEDVRLKQPTPSK